MPRDNEALSSSLPELARSLFTDNYVMPPAHLGLTSWPQKFITR
jgi:hypothetical protein